MNKIFSVIYETWFGLYNIEYRPIFDTLFTDGGYVKFGIAFTCIPILFWLLFYFAWRYPYGKAWHWILWLIVSSIVVFGSTFGLGYSAIFASNNPELIAALNDPSSGFEQYANTLPIKYAIINLGLAIVVGFVISPILKQFSKIQMHLPF